MRPIHALDETCIPSTYGINLSSQNPIRDEYDNVNAAVLVLVGVVLPRVWPLLSVLLWFGRTFCSM